MGNTLFWVFRNWGKQNGCLPETKERAKGWGSWAMWVKKWCGNPQGYISFSSIAAHNPTRGPGQATSHKCRNEEWQSSGSCRHRLTLRMEGGTRHIRKMGRKVPFIHPCFQHSFQDERKQSGENHAWAGKKVPFTCKGMLSADIACLLIPDCPFTEDWLYNPE